MGETTEEDVSKKVKTVCFTASSGGHYEQLMMLKSIMKKYNSFVITEKPEYNLNTEWEKTYYLKQINRKEIMFIPKVLYNGFLSIRIFLKEKPDVVISTGALATIPISLLAKLFNKKLIYIESFAKISSATLTGKLLYRIADQFYIQWEEMFEIFPNAIYKGGIY